ncbi:MAG: hypothetical protein MI861_07710 [Pirellulales bacterium]|nr:hypothetical protein [Pirellulales bacterium]
MALNLRPRYGSSYSQRSWPAVSQGGYIWRGRSDERYEHGWPLTCVVVRRSYDVYGASGNAPLATFVSRQWNSQAVVVNLLTACLIVAACFVLRPYMRSLERFYVFYCEELPP